MQQSSRPPGHKDVVIIVSVLNPFGYQVAPQFFKGVFGEDFEVEVQQFSTNFLFGRLNTSSVVTKHHHCSVQKKSKTANIHMLLPIHNG